MAKIELEPGETVLHRGSTLSKLWPVFLLLAVLTLFLWVTMLADFIEDIPVHPLILPFLLFTGLIPAAVVLAFAGPKFGLGEACVITDRRIMFKRGLFRPRIDEMPLADIEDAESGGSSLFIRGGGRTLEMQAYRNGLTTEVMARILPRWFPDAGKPAVRLGRILQPGERLIFRYPSPWFNRVLRGLMLCLILLFLWDGYEVLVDGNWRGVLRQVFWIFLMLSALPRVKNDWSSAVTDRRLLQHFDWDHSRYEEIPLAEIEAEWRSRFAEKLAARHNGRNLDVPAKGKNAERVLAAIEAAKGAT